MSDGGWTRAVPTNPWVAVDASTIPAKRARELRDAWEEFMADRGDDGAEGAGTPELRDPIVDSWWRSLDAGVDPTGRQAAPSVLEPEGTTARWQQHPLMPAMPVIDRCLESAAIDADNLIVVSDAEGVLLSVRGSAALRSRAFDDMNFVEGALWSESGAGTNAIGTAVAAGHAVQVFAAEHFTESVHRWTCAAAPMYDPDTGGLLGVIDVTGDISGVQPHSLAVVVATAQAVELFLRERLHERDDRLRERYAHQLTPSGAALVTGTGRLVFGRAPQWSAEDLPRCIPAGGGRLLLPSGRPAVAEPLSGRGRLRHAPRHSARTPDPPRARAHAARATAPRCVLDGEPIALRRRHLELLALLSMRHGSASADDLCAELYGDDGHPASIRVELSRLRKLVGGAIDAHQYRLACSVSSDFARVRALLARDDVTGAAAAYPGPLLPGSHAPGIERQRESLHGWLRQAVLTAGDVEALWAWATTPAGENDLLAWKRLLALVDYQDPRRSRIAARVASLRESAR